jgi:hypothetical protein
VSKRKSPYGKRGRPLGFKMSESSKRAIREAKRGQKHKEATKEKISRSLIVYFKKQNPLSEELINQYCRVDDDSMCEWINEYSDDIDNSINIRTRRSMINSRRIELTCGEFIEYYSHELTPEVIVLFKEKCDIEDIDPEKAYDDI